MNEGSLSLYEQLDTIREQIVTVNPESYMPLATSLGALGASLHISHRVRRSFTNAEPIDVFPLLCSFVLGLLVMNSTWATGVLDGATGAIIEDTEVVAESNREELQSVRDRLKVAEDADLARKQVETKEDTAWHGINWDGKMLEFKQGLTDMLRDFLQWLIEVTKLIPYTVASFMLLIMTILGPVALAFAIFDGFQQGLVSWIAHYTYLSLWPPVANTLQMMVNSIEIHMSNLQIAPLNGGGKDVNTWFVIMFYIVGLVAFITVPIVPGWIVEAGSDGGGLTRTLTSMGSRGAALAGGAVEGAVAMGWEAGLDKSRAPKREQRRVNEIAKGIGESFSDD